MGYDVYSKFDIEMHKKTYVNYLEVIIDSSGSVMYAVPSHQKRLEVLAAEMNNCTVKDIQDMCPPAMYFDYLTWLIELTGAVVVWTEFEHHGSKVTREQRSKLRQLKMKGIYRGPIIQPLKKTIDHNEDDHLE